MCFIVLVYKLYKFPSDAFARSLVRREEPARPDPRFAAPDAPLICTLNRVKTNFIRQESRAIGNV